jgi:hypothetical protein
MRRFAPNLEIAWPTKGALIALQIVRIVMPAEIDVLCHPNSC